MQKQNQLHLVQWFSELSFCSHAILMTVTDVLISIEAEERGGFSGLKKKKPLCCSNTC